MAKLELGSNHYLELEFSNSRHARLETQFHVKPGEVRWDLFIHIKHNLTAAGWREVASTSVKDVHFITALAELLKELSIVYKPQVDYSSYLSEDYNKLYQKFKYGHGISYHHADHLNIGPNEIDDWINPNKYDLYYQ